MLFINFLLILQPYLDSLLKDSIYIRKELIDPTLNDAGENLLIIVYSIKALPIRLTNERWNHIIRRHTELDGQKEKVLEIVQPDFIQVFEKKGGFIITAFFTSHPSKRRKIKWKQ